MFDVRLGNPDDPEDVERLKAQSPLFAADQIQAPLMVIQGANDPRVKQQESDQIVVALRERGFDVEYLVAEDEGHGFRDEENTLAMTAAMERFFAEHLGGRHQEAIPDEIQQTLADLTVDVDSVTLPDSLALQAAEDAAMAALPQADGSVINPTRLQYASTLQMQGQEMALQVTRTIEAATEDGASVWQVVDEAEMPQGTSTDTFVVAQESLKPIRRHAVGMGSMTLRYADDAITGEMSGGGQTAPVDMKLEAPVLGDGAGLELALAGLPLEEGYATTLRLFSPLTQQVRPMQLSVTGTERVEVPAGSFETYTVELEPLDGDPAGRATLQVMQEAPHHVVRGQYRLPAAMGGGTLSSELASIGVSAN